MKAPVVLPGFFVRGENHGYDHSLSGIFKSGWIPYHGR